MPTDLACLTHARISGGFHPIVVINSGNLLSEPAPGPPPVRRPQRPWADAEMALMRERYVTAEPVPLIAEQLRQLTGSTDQRSKGSIYAKARRLALRRPARGSKANAEPARSDVAPVSTIVLPIPEPSSEPKPVLSKINGLRITWQANICERADVFGSRSSTRRRSRKCLGRTSLRRRSAQRRIVSGFRVGSTVGIFQKISTRRGGPTAKPLPAHSDAGPVRRRGHAPDLSGDRQRILRAPRRAFSPQAKETKWWRAGIHCC